MRRGLALCGLLWLLPGCDGTLDPLERDARPATTRPAPLGVHFVEPFDYHYPDEILFDSIGTSLRLQAALGQRESAAFVYVPEAPGELRLSAVDLTAEDGSVFPARLIEVGVVTFANRTRVPNDRDPSDRLSMTYASGDRRGDTALDFRGLHQDARERLPVVPLAIVPDAIELRERLSGAGPVLSLLSSRLDSRQARAAAVVNEAIEFWVTVRIPSDLALSKLSQRFSGVLRLDVPGAALDVPIELEVLGFEPDTLEQHQRALGVMDALSRNPPEFRDAILTDLREMGCNALRDAVTDLGEYAELKARGFSHVINTSQSFALEQVPMVSELGIEPLFNGGLFEPTAEELALGVARGRELRAASAKLENEMTLAVERRASAELPHDAWLYSITTYELGPLHESELEEFLALLDAVRADPSSKRIPLSGHYAEVFNGHAVHQARLLYGLWFASSNLDLGLAYGYANSDGRNPFATPGYLGVAFPVELRDAVGAVVARKMLPSLTWEAFGAGIADARYALTARRLCQGHVDLLTRLDSLLRSYGPLYEQGDRVDYRNREADVRRTRSALAELILEAISRN